jgi:AcrR family transcriptional regulator
MDRRERKKAQTRDLIRTVAHAMFAEQGFDSVTIADIAQAADVAVQTVFNHFATKEQLFFDGRTPWVDGAAEAVRNRPLSISALDALCSYLAGVADSMVSDLGSTERGSYIATLEASDAPAHRRAARGVDLPPAPRPDRAGRSGDRRAAHGSHLAGRGPRAGPGEAVARGRGWEPGRDSGSRRPAAHADAAGAGNGERHQGRPATPHRLAAAGSPGRLIPTGQARQTEIRRRPARDWPRRPRA